MEGTAPSTIFTPTVGPLLTRKCRWFPVVADCPEHWVCRRGWHWEGRAQDASCKARWWWAWPPSQIQEPQLFWQRLHDLGPMVLAGSCPNSMPWFSQSQRNLTQEPTALWMLFLSPVSQLPCPTDQPLWYHRLQFENLVLAQQGQHQPAAQPDRRAPLPSNADPFWKM